MKFYLVVLLAGLCTTVVTAAPPSTPNFSFQEYEVFGDFGQKLKDYWVNLQCISDVVTKVVHGSEFENIWHETRNEIEKLINVEWKKCAELHDVSEQVKCKSLVIERGVRVIIAFGQRLIAAQKWDLVRKIKENIISQCLGNRDNLFEMVDQFEDSLPVQFECLVDVIGQVSKTHGLDELWSKSEPQLKHHIGNWKQCSSAGHPLLVLLCNVKEGVSTIIIANEYIKLAAAQDPKFLKDLLVQYKQKCGGVTDNNLLTDTFGVDGIEECVNKILEKIMCISDAISDAVIETDLNAIWEESKEDLQKLKNHLKACKNEQNTWEAAKCVSNELKFANQIFGKFLRNLKQANVEIYNKVKENIRESCFNA